MQVTVTTFDDSPRAVYEVAGYPVKVVVEPDAEGGESVVELWDEAGCQDRVTRPADQAQRAALKTLFNEYKADRSEGVVSGD